VTNELVTRIPEYGNEKRVEPVTSITRYSDQGVDHGDIFKVPPRVV
jgi:hypothetical protein